MKTKVSLIKCDSYSQALVSESVKKAVELLGGISAFVKPGSKVLVKPNMLMSVEPESGIVTHPEVVRGVIKLLKEIGCDIYVGDSPSAFGKYIEHVDEVYQKTGIKRLCEEENVHLVFFEKRKWHGKFPLTTWLSDCEYFINVPKFKTHGLTVLTGGIKNLFGLVCGTYKTELHKNFFDTESFSRMLVDLYLAVKPQLTIIDGISSLEGDGPGTSGKLRQDKLILAGVDCVALDSVLAKIMGILPLTVPTIKEASARAVGVSDLNQIEILGGNLTEFCTRDFLLPQTASWKKKLSPVLVVIAKKLIKYYPCVESDRCIACAACVRACPQKIISFKKNKISFDYKKCIACFCCQEVCPQGAIKTKKSIFARMIGL